MKCTTACKHPLWKWYTVLYDLITADKIRSWALSGRDIWVSIPKRNKMRKAWGREMASSSKTNSRRQRNPHYTMESWKDVLSRSQQPHWRKPVLCYVCIYTYVDIHIYLATWAQRKIWEDAPLMVIMPLAGLVERSARTRKRKARLVGVRQSKEKRAALKKCIWSHLCNHSNYICICVKKLH